MLRSRCLVALAALAFLVLPAVAQDKVPLKWKFEKGKTFYQEMTTTTKQEMKVMGQPISQTQDQTFYFSWTVKDQDKDKNWIVIQKIQGVKMNIQIGGNPITFDSTKPAQGNNPLSDFFKALVGSEFTLTISPKYEVIEVKGRQEFLDKLIKANQSMEPLLKQILSDEALKQMADPAFAVAPNKDVAKGESWTKDSKLNMGPIGSYQTTYKYIYDGKDEKNKDLDKIKVETTLKYSPPSDTMSNLPFKIKSADLKSKDATGTILWDNNKGRVASSEMGLKLEGTLKVEISGMTSDVTLDQTQKTTVKTSDTDLLPKPEKPAS